MSNDRELVRRVTVALRNVYVGAGRLEAEALLDQLDDQQVLTALRGSVRQSERLL